MILVVDTHALVWYAEDSPRLGSRARRLLLNPDVRFTVPTIVLAEARSLEESGRTKVSWDDILSALEADPRFEVYPLTLDVLRRMPRKQGLEMHDGIVCATAVLVAESTSEDVQVITKDRAIAASGLVETVW
jgi:PIN domain nuclease of toxin-antitoxin system